jgi:hypothetical protein
VRAVVALSIPNAAIVATNISVVEAPKEYRSEDATTEINGGVETAPAVGQ